MVDRGYARSEPLRDNVHRPDPLVRARALAQVVDAIWEDWNLDLPALQRQHPEITGEMVQSALRQNIPHLDSRVKRAVRGDAKPGSNRRAIAGVLAGRPAQPVRNARPITNKEREALSGAMRSKSSRALSLSEKTLLERARHTEKQPEASASKHKKQRVGGSPVNCKERPESTAKKTKARQRRRGSPQLYSMVRRNDAPPPLTS